MTNTIRKTVIGALASVLVLAGPSGSLAQQSSGPPKPQPIPLKVDVVIGRFQGEKKVGSLPFTLWVTANTNGFVSLRMGVDVPIGTTTVTSGVSNPTGPPGGPTGARTNSEVQSRPEYRNVGTSLDCNVSSKEDGRFSVSLNIQDSSIFSPDTEGRPAIKVADPMAFRMFSMSNTLTLRDGQTQQFTMATDKISGETIRVDVTINVVK